MERLSDMVLSRVPGTYMLFHKVVELNMEPHMENPFNKYFLLEEGIVCSLWFRAILFCFSKTEIQ